MRSMKKLSPVNIDTKISMPVSILNAIKLIKCQMILNLLWVIPSKKNPLFSAFFQYQSTINTIAPSFIVIKIELKMNKIKSTMLKLINSHQDELLNNNPPSMPKLFKS